MSGRDRLQQCFRSPKEAGKCLSELVPSTYTHACACGKAGCKHCGRRRNGTDYELDYVLVDYWSQENSPMIVGGLNRSKEWVVLQVPISLYYLQPAENRILNRQLLSVQDAKSMIQRLYSVLSSHEPGTKSASGVLVAPEAIVRSWRDKEKLSGRGGTIHQPAAEPICPTSAIPPGSDRKMYYDPFLKRCFVFTSQEQARLVELLNNQPAGYVTILQDPNKTKILLGYTTGPQGQTTAVIPQTPLIRARSPIDIPELMQLRFYEAKDEPAWLQFIAEQNRLGQTVSPQDFYIWLYREAERIRNWAISLGGEKQYCTQVLTLGWDDVNARCKVQAVTIPPPSSTSSLSANAQPELPPLERVPDEKLPFLPPIPGSAGGGPLQIVTIWADPITAVTTSPGFTQTTANLRGGNGTTNPEYVKLAWTSDGHVIVVHPPVLLAELVDNPKQLETLLIRPGSATQIIFQRLLNAVHTRMAALTKAGNRSNVQLFEVTTQDAKWNVIVEPTAVFRAQLAERIQYVVPALSATQCMEGKWDEDKRLCRRLCPPGFLTNGNDCIPVDKKDLKDLAADTKYVARAAEIKEDTSAVRLEKARKALDDYVTRTAQTNDAKAVALQQAVDVAYAEKEFEDTVENITESIEGLKLDQSQLAGPLIERLKQRKPTNLQGALEESWNQLKFARSVIGQSQPNTNQLRLYNQASTILVRYANTYNQLVVDVPTVPTVIAKEEKYIEQLTQVISELKTASNAVNAEITTLAQDQLSGKARDSKELEAVDDVYRAFADKLNEATIMRNIIEGEPMWKGEPASVPSPLRERIQKLLTGIDVYVQLNVPYVENLRNAHAKFNAYLPVCLRQNADISKESTYEDRISMIYVAGAEMVITVAWNQCGQWIVPVKDIPLASLGVDVPNIMFYKGTKYSSSDFTTSVAAARALPKNGMGAGTQLQPFKALTNVVINEIRAGVKHFVQVSNRLCSAYTYTSGGTQIENCVSVCLPDQQFDAATNECKVRPTQTTSVTSPIVESTAPPVLDLPLPGPLPNTRPPPPPPPRRPPVDTIPVSNILTDKSDNKDRARIYNNIKSETECGKATPDGRGYWNGTNCVPCRSDERWDDNQCIRKTVIITPADMTPEAPEAPEAPPSCAPDEVLDALTNECKKKPLKKPTETKQREEKKATTIPNTGALLTEIQNTGLTYNQVIAARAEAKNSKDRKSCEALSFRWEQDGDEGPYCNPCEADKEYIRNTGACATRIKGSAKTPVREAKKEQVSIADALKAALGNRRDALKGGGAKENIRERLTAANTESEAKSICEDPKVTKASTAVRDLAKDNDVAAQDSGKNVPIKELCFRIWKKIQEYK